MANGCNLHVGTTKAKSYYPTSGDIYYVDIWV
jgi:hypothetical protein